MMDQQLASDELQLVVFQLGDEYYGAEIGVIREIVTLTHITPVPRTPAYVKGVINSRGRVLPVIDLRRRLGLGVAEETKQTRIAVVEQDGGQVGMIVDGVTEVLRAAPDQIEPPPPVLGGIGSDFIKGVAKSQEKLVTLLDLDKVLAQGRQQLA